MINCKCRTIQFCKGLQYRHEVRLIKPDGLLFGTQDRYKIYKGRASGLDLQD